MAACSHPRPRPRPALRHRDTSQIQTLNHAPRPPTPHPRRDQHLLQRRGPPRQGKPAKPLSPPRSIQGAISPHHQACTRMHGSRGRSVALHAFAGCSWRGLMERVVSRRLGMEAPWRSTGEPQRPDLSLSTWALKVAAPGRCLVPTLTCLYQALSIFNKS